MAGFFVTGTDTGVGKTVVSCALVSALRDRGLDVGVMKACETGVGAEGPLDALALSEAAGAPDPMELVCPQRFAMPAAPSVAAAAEGRSVDVETIVAAYRTLSERHAVVVVEGAGGLLVPLTAGVDMADLASLLELPVLVVVRTALGTINHTLLTLAEIERRGLALAGVVASHADGPLDDADRANFAWLRDRLGGRLVGEIPPLGPGGNGASSDLSVERILARCHEVRAATD